MINQEELVALMARVNKDHPRQEDIQKFRQVLKETPAFLEMAGSMAHNCKQTLLKASKQNAASCEVLDVGMDYLQRELESQGSSRLEKMIIEQIVLCYLRLHLWENIYHANAGSIGLDAKQAKEWENLLSAAQKRYLRAVESLARIRKLGGQVQVNIASDGGQQVNVTNLTIQHSNE